jgi:hypothetical protein
MKKPDLKSRITTVFNNFITAISQHADINKKRADGGWSVGQIADHLVKGTDTNLGATKKTDRPYDKNAAEIKALFLDFTKKFPSDPSIRPDEKQFSKNDLISTLRKSCENVLRMIDNEDLTVTCIDWEIPGWGNLTKYECVILYENHIIRHTKQVRDFDKIKT